MGGERGSTSGLRFNPRESAEEIQEDSAVGREDSEERAKHDAKKQHEQDKRARMLEGIQHLKIKIPQQNTEDEERPTEEAGQVGQVGQADAIDGANPRSNGQGMGIMMSDCAPLEDAFDSIKKKDKNEPKFDTDKPQPTTTIDTVRARQRAKKGSKRRKRGTKTLESIKNKRKKKAGQRLRAGVSRNPGSATGLAASQRAIQLSPAYSRFYSTQPNYVTQFSGRSRPKTSYSDPREKESQSLRGEMKQHMPTQPLTPSIPTVTPKSRIAHAPRGSPKYRDALLGPKKQHTPRKPNTPMGVGHSKATDLAMGGSSMFSPDDDAVLASLEFIKKGVIGDYLNNKAKKGMSFADRSEYRRLVAKLEKLLRNLTRKMDASLDPAPDGPTPNAHPRLTSAPTGATEADPDDDPTMWGTHAYGLYTRRGGL
ncbi:MAG: hypothetical protein HOC79_08820 [Euryarchaeota archaeon]|nr:hypothetical protein [Euryarchaeota archaeon]